MQFFYQDINTYFIIIFILLNINLSMAKTKMYIIEEEKFLTWNKAFEECNKMGMHLVSLKSEEEFRYLKEYINKEYGRIYPYWLGAYKKDGYFQWAANGERINLFNWHAGEPNDKSGHENCIHTWERDFDWNDNDCERELPFICELEI